MRSNGKPRPPEMRPARRFWRKILALLSLICLLPLTSAWGQSLLPPSTPPGSAAPSEPESWLPAGSLLLSEEDLSQIVDDAIAGAVRVAVAEERALRAQAVVERDRYQRLAKEAAAREEQERAKVFVLSIASGLFAVATAILGVVVGIRP